MKERLYNQINRMPIGVSSFEKIRKSGAYYIDKTNLIEELIAAEAEVTLFTRPRRFGKTLVMRMLESFFTIEKDSRELFAGLNVSKNTQLCDTYMNQYPTIFITLKDVYGGNFETAFHKLRDKIGFLCENFLFLLTSDKLDKNKQELFFKLKEGCATELETIDALTILVRLLYLHYEKPVILLVDEYDVPLAKASDYGYYDEMLDVMRGFMQVFKDNDYLKFAVITGCLCVSKESIFTGTNNFRVNSITSNYFNEYFGFTDIEVKKLLDDIGALAQYSTVKEWYDGYNFGGIDIYCPWDVINYAHDYLISGTNFPKCYWNNTSDNSIVRTFIDKFSDEIQDDFESLVKGQSIKVIIREDLTYDLLHASKDNFWSILFLTGYLTSDDCDSLDEMTLRIPNKEVAKIYKDTISQWFEDTITALDRKKLLTALWSEDTETLTRQLTRVLVTTISYHDYKEDFYHAFLAGIFAGLGYKVESNKEHGEGRSDVVIKDKKNFRVAVFEIKYSDKKINMEKDCGKALTQIADRQYAIDYEDDFDEILCYGITFYKKRCLVKGL